MKRITTLSSAMGYMAGLALVGGSSLVAYNAMKPETAQTSSAEPGKPKFVSREDILPSGALYMTDSVEVRRRDPFANAEQKQNTERVLTVYGTDGKGRSYVIELDFPMSEKDFYKGAEDLATSRTKGEKFEVKWKDDHFRTRAGRPLLYIKQVTAYEMDGKMVYILRVISPGFVKIIED